MNKMKRIFSLVLALVMVLGAFGNVVPAFAETVDAEVTTQELTKVPADVIGTEYEAAVRRLVAFGLVEGYPDGTYQPEKEINRAQFAKLLVVALGLDDAVRAAEGQSTGFSDVKGDYWAAGYINVASGQGLLKGYPDGTFRPAAKVTYAHALTMLVRALGYQDEFLPGNWPGNYVAKAADVGITRGLRLPAASTEGSKRGIVAQLINNTLDSKVVEIKKYVGISGIEYEETKETLLKNKLDISKHEDTRIYADKIVDDSLRKEEVRVRFLEDTRVKEEVRKDYTKGQTATFDSKINVRPMIGEEVTTYLTDRDVVIYVERENNDRANFDYVEDVDGKEEVSLVKFDKDYKFETDADVYIFDGSDSEYKDFKGEDLKAEHFDKMLGKVGKFVVRNNRIVYAEVQQSTELEPWLVVMENDNNVLQGIRQTTEDYKLDLTKGRNYDEVFVFDTEGNELAVKDIKKGNLVYAQEQDYDGDDVAVVTVVQDNKVTGEVGKFRTDRVEIGGKTYKAMRYKTGDTSKFDAYYSVDGLEDIKKWDDGDIETDLDDAYKEEVTAYLDATGKIAFLTTDIDSVSGFKFGVVTRTYADGDRVRIYTTIDGKEGKDTIFKADTESNLTKPKVIKLDGNGKYTEVAEKHNVLGQPVKFKLNNDGEIGKDDFYVMDNSLVAKMAADFGKDTMKVTIGSAEKSFSVNDNIDIIDAEGLNPRDSAFGPSGTYGDIEVKQTTRKVEVDDFDIVKWADMKEDNKDTDLEFYVFPKSNRVNEVDGLVFTGPKGANTGSDEVAIYVIKKDRRGDNIEIEYVEYGKGKETKVVDNATNLGDVTIERAYVAKHKSNGKIELLHKDNLDTNETTKDFNIYRKVKVTQTGSELKADGKTFVYRGSPVTYFKDGIKDARVNDVVDLIVEDDVMVRVVGIRTEAAKTTPDTKTGKVTYINKTAYNSTFGRFNVQDKDAKESNIFIADMTGFKFKDATTEVAVSKEAMTLWLADSANAADVAAGKSIEVVDGKTLVIPVAAAATQKTAAIQLVVDAEEAKLAGNYNVPFGTAAADVNATVKALAEADVNTNLVTVTYNGTNVVLTSKEDTTVTKSKTVSNAILGAISGLIGDGTNPVAGAVVEVTGGTDTFTATTAADGTYKIVNVPAGTSYTATVKKAGYLDGVITTFTVTAATEATGTNATLIKDTTAPALGGTGLDAATLNAAGTTGITIGTTSANNQIFEAESGVASVVINIAGTNYTGTVNAAGTNVTIAGLPAVTAGVNYTITMTDNAGNTATVVAVVQ